MNLSDFSLLKEDSDSYTVGHPKGKSMTVPKKGLSSKAQELVSKLKRHQNYDEGGEIPQLKNSSDWTDTDTVAPAQFANEQAAPAPMAAQAPANSLDAQEQADIQAMPGATPPPVAPKMTAEAEQAANPQEATEQAPPAATPQKPTLLPEDTAGLGEAKNMILGGVKAQKEYGKSVESLNNQAADINLAHKKTQDQNLNEFNAKSAIFEKAVADGKIDPERVWHNMSTGSKIASSIGLILSGLGAGVTGQPNVAQQFMNEAIARDIDAQKNDQSKNMNLWKMNREHYGDTLQADLATQSQELSAVKAKLMAAQGRTLGPLAAQQAAQAIEGINHQIATTNWLHSRLSGGAPGTEQQHVAELQVMQQLRPDFYKDMESKYIPGVGTSRVPLTQSDKEALTGYDALTNALRDAKEFNVRVGTTFPGTTNNAIAKQKTDALIPEINKLQNLSRLNKEEYNLFSDMASGLGSLRSDVTAAKLTELENLVMAKKKNDLKHLGVTPFKTAASDQLAIAWARANPGPQAQAILAANGVK